MSFARRGILLGIWPFGFAVAVVVVVVVFGMGAGLDTAGSFLFVVDRKTRTGRSDAAVLELVARVDAGFGLTLLTGGARASAGRTSFFSSSSSDSSMASELRLAAGVLRGWPGGAISFACAAAAATWRLGVTGGRGIGGGVLGTAMDDEVVVVVVVN